MPDAQERLIVALNQPTVDAALRLIDTLDGVVSFFKVGLQMQLMPAIGALIDHLLSNDKRLFLDYKYYDTVETVRDAVARAATMGVTFLTIHGNRDIIEAAVAARGGAALELLAVTVLTNLDARDLEEMFARPVAVEELVLHRAAKAVEFGCDGVVASMNEAAAIRRMAGAAALTIVTPGIRLAGSGSDDHKRPGTPADAIAAGADYLVVGRPIINAAHPVAAAQAHIDAIRAAVDAGAGP